MSRIARAITVLAVLGLTPLALAHCEIPCGIYDDQTRIVLLREDIATIEKSMRSIQEIGAQAKPEWNQLVRWTVNKEDHANKIQDIASQYFLTQRVKAPAAGDAEAQQKYVTQLTLLHKLLVVAMKMKQTTDLAFVADARKVVDDFAASYFTPEDLKHLQEHK